MVRWAWTERWPSIEAFWAESLEARREALQDKYGRLIHWIAQPSGIARDRGLRELAAQWPGALREGQLASVDDLRARQAALAEAGTAAALRELGHAAVPLWATLHQLLGDLATMRGPRPDATTPIPGAAADRWPVDPTWWSAIPWPADSRLARAWLGAIAGVEAIDGALGRRPR
jgi:hypothetical protein